MKDENKRDLYLKVRVSQAEMDAIKKKFANSGMSSLSTFVRAIGVGIWSGISYFKGTQEMKDAYYNRTFVPIPMFIVDEADIVSYTTDEQGNQKKQIEFDQFVYYQAASCNRQEVGVGAFEDAQNGVSD